MIRLGLRYARITGDGTLRVCLRLVVVGTAGALIYLVNKVILAAAGPHGPLFVSLEGGWLDPSNTRNLREALDAPGSPG